MAEVMNNEKKENNKNISKSTNDPIPGTSYTEHRQTSRYTARMSSYAQMGFITAQRNVDYAKERLKNAQRIKDRAGHNLKCKKIRYEKTNVNIDYMKKILSISKRTDDIAAANLLLAKRRLENAVDKLEKMRTKVGKYNIDAPN